VKIKYATVSAKEAKNDEGMRPLLFARNLLRQIIAQPSATKPEVLEGDQPANAKTCCTAKAYPDPSGPALL
jgi:hypothetical protein